MDEATRLANTYMPYESDERLSLEDKKGKMYEWWSTHYGVLKEKGLSRSTLDKVADDMNFAFREGALEFMDYLNRLEVPMLILSSSGIGNCIENFLEREGRNYDNIYVISNFIEFDEKGYMTGIKGGIIHPFNKGEVALKEFPKAYDAVKDRKNVLLLGDSRGDANMAGGPEYRNISRFGFLNDNVEESIESYKQTFDVVLTHDTDMDYINDILKGFEE